MKKLLALVLSLALFAAVIPASTAFAAEEEYITGTVSYAGGNGTYYYTDSYFDSPASLYNPSLATVSLYATLAASGRSSAAATLANMGFKDIVFNDDYITSGIDTMGTVVAHKTIFSGGVPYTLIIVDTRAGTAFTEWGGNFTLGENGNHKGFNLAAEEIYRSLDSYIEAYAEAFESNAIKIWTMGYSRSAASSNLFAAMLTDEVREDMKVASWGDTLTLTTENIYAYTFETPVGGSTDNVSVADAEANYTNIHNIINPADLVTMVAPTEWGFVRYGVDENVIPATGTERYAELYDEMLKRFIAYGGSDVEGQIIYDEDGNPQHILSSFTGNRLTLNGVEATDITVEAFLDDIFTELTTAIGSRSNYVADAEAAARNIIYYCCCNLDADLIKAFGESLSGKLRNNYAEIFAAALAGQDELYDTLYGLALEASSESGLDLFSVPRLKEYVKQLMPYAADVITSDILYSRGEALLTLVNNITTVISAHYPELCIAWLECQDTNYNPDAKSVVPEYCVYQKETAAKVGNYTMTMDGISKNITVTRGSNGFNLFSTADGKYISLSGSKAVLTDTPYCWYYNGGFYVSTRSTLVSRLFSRYGKTYLTFNAEGFGTSSSLKTVTVFETVRSTDHTLAYNCNDLDTHTVKCAYCNAVISECEQHSYNGDRCACGQLSPEAAMPTGIDVSVERAWLWEYFSVGNVITISPEAKYAVTSVQYSLDGGSTWSNGNTFTQKKSVPDFLIRITDASGTASVWSYCSATGKAAIA